MGTMHKRLVGTWKSSRQKTLKTFAGYGQAPRSRQHQIAAIFGKLELRYTRTYCFITLDGVTTRERYEVVAEDPNSIVIRTFSEGTKKKIDPVILRDIEGFFAPKLQHLHFESIGGRAYYWVGGRVFVEWFVQKRPTSRSC